MKKSIAILLSVIVIISSVFVACSSSKKNEKSTAPIASEGAGLDDAVNNYGFENIDVTDKDGKAVTDKNGKKVTTQVAVRYETNKKGKTVAKILDDKGNVVTDKNGKEVTVKTDVDSTEKSKTKTTKSDKTKVPTTKPTKSTSSTTAKTTGGEVTTENEITTLDISKDKVPTIASAKKSKTKKTVTFSSEDQQIIKNMLEVPYLYSKNYENANGVPIELATHAALWMAEREGLNTSSYASGTIVLDLFKYFGQTVVNFKTKCNDQGNNDKIKYNSKNDTFSITNFENKKQNVKITKIEFLGNNNYYLVTADVSGAGSKDKVYAIIQKNKLDISLGFSIKALEWS